MHKGHSRSTLSSISAVPSKFREYYYTFASVVDQLWYNYNNLVAGKGDSMVDTWDSPIHLADLIAMQLNGDGTSRVFAIPDKKVVLTIYRAFRPNVAKVVIARDETYEILDRRHFKSLASVVSYLNKLIAN